MVIALSLIALAVGYKVFAEAWKEKNGLRVFGQVVGIFIMLAAFASVLCSTMKFIGMGYCPKGWGKAAYWRNQMCPSSCPMMAQKVNCPMMGAPQDQSAS